MKKLMLILIVLALAGGGFWFYKKQKDKAAAAAETQKFTPAKVEQKTLCRTIDSTGQVSPDNRLEVKSPVSGRIEQLLIQEGDRVKKDQIIAWISSTERATMLDTARAKSEADLKYWEEMYKASPLVAPMSGTVIARSFEPGQTISSSDSVVVIADRLIVVGQADETDIGSIFTGQRVSVQLDAYPDSLFEGSVRNIAYDSKLVSNVTMYEVDVLPLNLPPVARSGMTATLTFLVEEHAEVPAVPTAAISYHNGKAFVTLPATDGNEPETRPVKTGLSENSFTEIIRGLKVGDDVLIPQMVRKKESSSTNPFMTVPGRTGSGGGSHGGGSRPSGGSR
jgi:macrolide-specific efflux system membrane fusion protein